MWRPRTQSRMSLVSPSLDQTVISAIVPRSVVTAEAFGDRADAVLLPEEAAALDRAVEKRRREFATARCLARGALARLGMPPIPILPGTNREPTWPEGVVGSITHCPGYCAAVVARSSIVCAIGIDAEVHEMLPEDLLGMVTSEDERRWNRARAGDRVCWDRLLFSAKESVFKAWFPATRRWLDFQDVCVRFDPDMGRFRADLVSERATVADRVISSFEGRYLLHGDLILTAVVIEPPASGPR
jgi:4'-phosphopantetheinyl transferase EntD